MKKSSEILFLLLLVFCCRSFALEEMDDDYSLSYGEPAVSERKINRNEDGLKKYFDKVEDAIRKALPYSRISRIENSFIIENEPIFFEKKSSSAVGVELDKIEKIAAVLAKFYKQKFSLKGKASGSDEDNDSIVDDRISFVKKILIDGGVSEGRINVLPSAKDKPIIGNGFVEIIFE